MSLKAVNDEGFSNGKGARCPFYEVGYTDFSEFKNETAKELSRIGDVLEQIGSFVVSTGTKLVNLFIRIVYLAFIVAIGWKGIDIAKASGLFE